MRERKRDVPISAIATYIKATEFAKINDFKALNKWFWWWKKIDVA